MTKIAIINTNDGIKEVLLKDAWASTSFKPNTGGLLEPTIQKDSTLIGNGTVEDPSGINPDFISSGIYTPAAAGVANIIAITPYVTKWIRIGNFVYVSGKIDIDPAAATTPTSIEISKPIASNLTVDHDAHGVAISSNAGYADIKANPTSDNFVLTFTTSTFVLNSSWFFNLMYEVK